MYKKTEYDRDYGMSAYCQPQSHVSLESISSRAVSFCRGRVGAKLLLTAGCVLCLSMFSPYISALNAISNNEAQSFIAVSEERRMVQSQYGLSAADGSSYIVSTTDSIPEEDYFPLVITDGGVEHEIMFAGGTVSQALDAAGIEHPDNDDIISPSIERVISEGMSINISRVTYEEYVALEPIPFKTVTQENPSITAEDGAIISLGFDGEKRVVYQRKWVNGKLDSEKVLSETVTREAVDEIVEKGTAKTTAAATAEKATATEKKTTATAAETTVTAKKTTTTTEKTAATAKKTTTTAEKITTTAKKTTTTAEKTTTTAKKTTTTTENKTTASTEKKTTTTTSEPEATTTTQTKPVTTETEAAATEAATTATTAATAAETAAAITTTTTIATTTEAPAATTTEAPAVEAAPPVDEESSKSEQNSGNNDDDDDKTFTDSSGRKVSYTRKLTGKGTAYTEEPGSLTATGREVEIGVVAVDPDVIPYNSRLYIVSSDGKTVYGYAIAADTGSALRSGKVLVDLFYDTESQCKAFGRRDVIVYVL